MLDGSQVPGARPNNPERIREASPYADAAGIVRGRLEVRYQAEFSSRDAEVLKHPAGTTLGSWRHAAELLESEGVIETRQPMDQYRLKSPPER